MVGVHCRLASSGRVQWLLKMHSSDEVYKQPNYLLPTPVPPLPFVAHVSVFRLPYPEPGPISELNNVSGRKGWMDRWWKALLSPSPTQPRLSAAETHCCQMQLAFLNSNIFLLIPSVSSHLIWHQCYIYSLSLILLFFFKYLSKNMQLGGWKMSLSAIPGSP